MYTSVSLDTTCGVSLRVSSVFCFGAPLFFVVAVCVVVVVVFAALKTRVGRVSPPCNLDPTGDSIRD